MTAFPAPLLFETEVFEDHRGFLYEAYHRERFNEQVGGEVRFVQENHTHSKAGVLRGLHYQLPPSAQGKLVRVVSGSIFDVAVDVRRPSPAFGSWQGHELNSEDRHQLWVPPGYAHGFLVTSDTADVVYRLTTHHDPALSRAIRWDDPDVGIIWPTAIEPILSDRDRSAPSLTNAEVFE